MISDYVVVFRMEDNIDMMGIIIGDSTGKVKIEHPYFTSFNPANGNIGMMPYCPLTDQTLFEFDRSKIKFLATAAPLVASRFIDYMNQMSNQKYDLLPHTCDNPASYVAGNSSLH